MFDIEKLENNVIDLVKFLNNNELLKNEKFYDIYKINEDIKNNFLFLIENLELKKIKNINEIKSKLSQNIKYFFDFNFIKKKYDLNQIYQLSSLDQMKENNQIVLDIINFFNEKKLVLPGIIFLGYQKTEILNNLIKEINFFSNSIEKNFDLFIEKIKAFNNIEKRNALNYYQDIYNNVSNNFELLSELTKINKNYFSFKEYKYFESKLNNKIDTNVLSDTPLSVTDFDSDYKNKIVSFSNVNNIISKLDSFKEKKLYIIEMGKNIGLTPDNNKQLKNLENIFLTFSTANKDELIKQINFFDEIYSFSLDSGIEKFFDKEKILVSFNLKEDFQNISKKINNYFQELENYFKNTTLKYLLSSFKFVKNIIDISDKEFNLNKKNLLEKLSSEGDEIQFLNKTLNLLIKNEDNLSISKYYDSIKEFIDENQLKKLEDCLKPEYVNIIVKKLNDFLNNETFLKSFSTIKKEKLILLKENFNFLNQKSDINNIYIKELDNYLNNLLYFIPLDIDKNKNYDKVKINFLKIIFENHVIEFYDENQIEQAIIDEFRFLFTNLFDSFYNEGQKYSYFEEFEEFLNNPLNKDKIDNFVNKNNKYLNLKNDLINFKFKYLLRPNIYKKTAIILENFEKDLELNEFQSIILEIKEIVDEYYLTQNINFSLNYGKCAELVINIFLEETEKNNLGVFDQYFQDIIDLAKSFDLSKTDSNKIAESVNVLFNNYYDFFNYQSFAKNYLNSQKKAIDDLLNEITKLYNTQKNQFFNLNDNLFIKSFISEQEYKNAFPIIKEIEDYINIKNNLTDEDYLAKGKNFFNELNNINIKLNVNDLYDEINIFIFKNFFEKFNKKIIDENLNQTNYFTQENIDKLSDILDIKTFFNEIYNLNLINKIDENNFQSIFSYYFELKNFSEKAKHLKSFDEYKTNFLEINNFIKELLDIKEKIKNDLFTEELKNYKIDPNSIFLNEKQNIVDKFKEYQRKEIYKKYYLNSNILKNNFSNINLNVLNSINFLISKKDQIKTISDNIENNKKLVFDLKNLFEEKYYLFNILFQVKDKQEDEFNKLSDIFEQIINSDKNFSVQIDFLPNFTIDIDFKKDDLTFKNQDLDGLNYVVKKFFDFLFAKHIYEHTKLEKNSFSSLVWDKIIKENENLKNFYDSWIDDSFIHDFTNNNEIVNNFKDDFKTFLEIKENLDNKFTNLSNLNTIFDKLVEKKKHLFFFFSKKELENYNYKILENIYLNNLTFIEDFKKKFLISNHELNNFNNFENYDQFILDLNNNVKKILFENINIADSMFKSFNKLFEEKLDIFKGFNFIKYILTSNDANKFKLLFNKFDKTKTLNFENLNIIKNIETYNNYFNNSYNTFYDEKQNTDIIKDIKTLFELTPFLDQYFLCAAKAYLYINSPLINQEKFDEYIKSVVTTDYDTKEKYDQEYFDFSRDIYLEHQNNVATYWTVENIKNIHNQVFTIDEDLNLFSRKINTLINFSNNKDFLNFQNKLDINNENFKINYIELEKNKLLKDWTNFFNDFFDEYKIFSFRKNYLVEEYFTDIKNSFAINQFINLKKSDFLLKIDSVKNSFNIKNNKFSDEQKEIILKKLVLDLKNNLISNSDFDKLKNNLEDKEKANKIKTLLSPLFKLYFLSDEDLNLNDVELKKKYNNATSDKYIFKNNKEKIDLFDSLKNFENFYEYTKIFSYKLKIIDEYFDAIKSVKEKNYNQFAFLFYFKETLISKYKQIQDVDNNILIDFIEKNVDNKTLQDIEIKRLKHLLRTIRNYKKDKTILKEINDYYINYDEEEEVNKIFSEPEPWKLVLERYKENLDISKINNFSKSDVYNLIGNILQANENNFLLFNLEFLIKEIDQIKKEKYYQEIFLIDLKERDIFLNVEKQIDDIIKKMDAEPDLTGNYSVKLLNEELNLNMDDEDFQEKVSNYIENKKNEILSKIIVFYKNKINELKNYYKGFYEKIKINIDSSKKDVIEKLFNNFNPNNIDNLWKKLEKDEITQDLNIFNKFFQEIKKGIENTIKESLISLKKEIESKSVITKIEKELFERLFDETGDKVKFIEDIDVDHLNFDLNDPTSCVDLKKIYHLFSDKFFIHSQKKYDYGTFILLLDNLKELYLTEDKKIFEKLILEIKKLYDPLSSEYQGYHYTNNEEFKLYYDNFINNKNFYDLSGNDKKYYIYQFSKKGLIFNKFISEQVDLFFKEKNEILKDLGTNSFFGYYFNEFYNNKLWFKIPSYIDEFINFLPDLGQNAPSILKSKFINPKTIDFIKENIKNDIVLFSLDYLFSLQKEHFSNFWYKDFDKEIHNLPIDYEKTKNLINNSHFNFSLNELFELFDNIKLPQIYNEQKAIGDKIQNIFDSSFSIKNIESIFEVEKTDYSFVLNSLTKEKDYIYSFIDNNKKEKYFIIGIEYGFIIVLKTNNLTDDIKNCDITDKIIFDLNNNKTYKFSTEDKVIVDDDKIIIEDDNKKELIVVKYSNSSLNTATEKNITKEDLATMNLYNFSYFPKNTIVEIDNYLNKDSENYIYRIGWTFTPSIWSDSFLMPFTFFYKQNKNNEQDKEIIFCQIYNENEKFLFLHHSLDSNWNKQKENVITTNLFDFDYNSDEVIEYFKANNIKYQKPNLSNAFNNKDDKNWPFYVGGIGIAAFAGGSYIYLKNRKKRKESLKNNKK